MVNVRHDPMTVLTNITGAYSALTGSPMAVSDVQSQKRPDRGPQLLLRFEGHRVRARRQVRAPAPAASHLGHLPGAHNYRGL